MFHCQYVFALGPESIFYFAADGTVKNSLPDELTAPVEKRKLRYSRNFESDGRITVSCRGKNYSGSPGDYITPVFDDGNFIWLVSENNCNFANIVKWNPDTNQKNHFSVPDKEIIGAVADGNKVKFPTSTNAQRLVIGADPTDNKKTVQAGWYGDIGMVRVYDESLSAADVAQRFASLTLPAN